MLVPERKERNTIQEIFLSGRYVILSVLREREGCTVYLVRHQKLGECRIIKRISKEAAFIWQIREADILNHLRNPKIPILYDIEEDTQYYYMIEGYAVGESLEALMLQSSCITMEFIYQTILEIADILAYLHHLTPKPLIYQDLKGEHLIVGKNGIKLIDFGIACYLGESGDKFQNYGTPEFCAPEKIYEGTADIRTDIYSLGKLLEKMIVSSDDMRADCLLAAAKKAASANPKDRYADIEQFQTDIKTFVQTKQNPEQTHLLQKIVIAGSQPHIGCTHAAIALTNYLNCRHLQAIYVEKNSSKAIWKLVSAGGFTEENGIYHRGNFLGIPYYGEGVSVRIPAGAIEVLDYGTNIEIAALETCDLRILVVGSSKWEEADANKAYKTVEQSKDWVVLSNYGRKKEAKAYAQNWKQKVYSFPLDKEPFKLTREKEQLFADLLSSKGGVSKNLAKGHWNCRKHSWLRSHLFSSCLGKFSSRRLW